MNAELAINACLAADNSSVKYQHHFQFLLRYFETMAQDPLWMLNHAESAKTVIRAVTLFYLKEKEDSLIVRIHYIVRRSFDFLVDFAPKDLIHEASIVTKDSWTKKEIPASLLLLAVKFPYFRTFFRNNLHKSLAVVAFYPKNDTDPKPKCTMLDILPQFACDAFDSILRKYPYRLEMFFLPILDQLVAYAEFIGLPQKEILETIQTSMLNILTPDRAIQWLPFAYKYDLDTLQTACENEIDRCLRDGNNISQLICTLEKELPDESYEVLINSEPTLCQKVDESTADFLYKTALKYRLLKLRAACEKILVPTYDAELELG